ncbi:MAG: ROK family protein [Steroidobacteraceae bacterium]|jgi:fructokinase
MSLTRALLGGVELGGTKCICLLGTGPQDIRAQRSIPTGQDPGATLRAIVATFEGWRAHHGPIAALGIASFGPLELARSSAHYGYITTTPKSGWADTDVAGTLGRALQVPIGFDTDVNGAARAEARWGAAQGLEDLAYITVGTGIGVGLMVAGHPVLGFTHGELGHIRVARSSGDSWSGACSFHGDCLEGLASGTAIEMRTGVPAASLAADAPAWAFVTHALAQLLHVLVLATAPRRILMGGSVMLGQPHLFPRLRTELQRSLNHYVRAPQLAEHIAQYVVPPGLAEMAGPLGALAVAADVLAGD